MLMDSLGQEDGQGTAESLVSALRYLGPQLGGLKQLGLTRVLRVQNLEASIFPSCFCKVGLKSGCLWSTHTPGFSSLVVSG